MIAGVTAIMTPDLYPFHQSGQVEGFLGGLVGAADYEYLTESPGEAMAGMNVQSLGHLFILGLVLLGNIVYFYGRYAEKRAK